MIEVRQTGHGDPLEFEVTVIAGAARTRHVVTLSRADLGRLARGHSAHALVRAAFLFLLDREPTGSILGQFDIRVIGRYFPEFEQRLPDYFCRWSGEMRAAAD